MKIKLSQNEIKELAKNPNVNVKSSDSWWVITLKVIAYLVGLLLAGSCTPSAIAMFQQGVYSIV